MPNDKLVPFGKHKGQPIEALLEDRQYLDWLTQQAWFREKYVTIYNVVINNGVEPSETPEHNAMQIRLLEKDYRLRLAIAVCPDLPNVMAQASSDAITGQIAEMSDVQAEIAAKFYAEEQPKREALPTSPPRLGDPDYYSKERAYRRATESAPVCAKFTPPFLSIEVPLQIGRPDFESDGVDVCFSVKVRYFIEGRRFGLVYGSGDEYSFDPEWTRHDKPALIADAPLIHSIHFEQTFLVEIKPTIGDDYPAVLRQIKRVRSYGKRVLLVGRYTGVGATEQQFRDFFQSQGVTVIFDDEVDAVQLPASQ